MKEPISILPFVAHCGIIFAMKTVVVGYREQIEKIIEDLPEEQLKIALGFLGGLGSGRLRRQKQVRLRSVYPWIKYLSTSEIEEFMKELLEAIRDSTTNGDWRQVEEVIDCWQETAEILSNKEIMQEISEAETQIEKGNTIPWKEVKRRLNTK